MLNYQKSESFECSNSNDYEKIISKIIALKVQFIYLIGDYGVGKTFFVKELGKFLGLKDNITSPSFNFCFVYNKLVHIDLDNFKSDLSEFYDYFEDKLVVIEWANKLDNFETNSVCLKINFIDENKRKVELFYN